MNSSFYGIDGVEYIYHGDWSDPEIKYKGYIFNYYDLEEMLLASYKEEVSEKSLDKTSKTFEQFLKENQDVVYFKIEDMIFNYWKTNLLDSPFKEINTLKEKINLDIFNQSLLYQIKAIESSYDVEFLDYFKVQELQVTSDEEFYEYLMKTCFELKENTQWLKELNGFSKAMEEEIEEYKISEEKIKQGEAVFRQDDLEEGINIKLKEGKYLSFWNSSDGEGIYYEIKDSSLEEIDGGVQLYGLVNTRNEILQKDLVNSLLELSGMSKQENLEKLDNGNLEDILEIEEEEDCL